MIVNPIRAFRFAKAGNYQGRPLTLAQVAYSTGINISTLARLEAGEAEPSEKDLATLSRILRIEPARLLDRFHQTARMT